MGYVRLDEISFGCHFDGLLFAVKAGGNEECYSYNSALALEDLFRFVAEERFERGCPISRHKWQRIAEILIDSSVNTNGRGRLLRSLQVFPNKPADFRFDLRSALEDCIYDDEAEVAVEALLLARQWRVFSSEHAEALCGAIENASNVNTADIDEFAADTATLFAALPMTRGQLLRTAELMLSDDFYVSFLAGKCILALGEKGRFVLKQVQACLKKNELGVDDCMFDLATEILEGLGIVSEVASPA